MYENEFPHKRYQLTLAFLKKYIATDLSILDLGIRNPFTEVMEANGYVVENTKGEDLDFDQSRIQKSQASVFTAFEIFEHLLNPFAVLQAIPAKHLVLSVPLKLWFAPAYKSKTDMWDRHYHEFEDWQLDWLLEKTGWKIVSSKKWTNPNGKIGIRPILRRFTSRYYIVYAKRP